MQEVTGEVLQDRIVLKLSGHIDSGNVSVAENAALQVIGNACDLPVLIDASELEYISSAGLRMILRIRKDHPDMTITGVSSEVYEILEMTGFTQMMKVSKAYKTISIEGAEEIGHGANGIVYRIGDDMVVKVYYDSDALDDIQHEREVAREALVLGIPTAISYDVVRVGNSYGSVFELLHAKNFSKILANEPEKLDWCVKEYVDLLKQIHSTKVPKGSLPDFRDWVIEWAEFMQGHLPEDAGKKLMDLIRAVPHTDHMIHGDYHTKNVQLVDGEVLLIDMDTLSVGDPIFELGCMYNAFIGFNEYDPTVIEEFQGYDQEIAREFWQKALAAYIGTENQTKLKNVEDKARVVGYTRLIRRAIRRNGLETEDGRAEIDLWKSHLLELLEKTDSLLFTCNEKEFDADISSLSAVMEFIGSLLDEVECPPKAKMQLEVAAEEIFVNVSSYAYTPGTGKVTVRVNEGQEPGSVVITFMDSGKPFDPLAHEDPDVTLSAEERQIGGLGIFMTKQMADEITYCYEGGKNILTLKKNIA